MPIRRIIIFGGIIVLVLATFLLVTFYAHKITYDENTELPGLDADVEVYYDEYAIPHIYADSRPDAYVALGYVHAKERLWQMEILRRIASGRLSEIFGPASLETDRFFRSMGLDAYGKNAAQRFLNTADPKIKDLVLNYLEGVNHFIKNGLTPVEYRLLGIKKTPFELHDVYHVSDYLAFSFAMAHKTEPVLTAILEQFGAEYLEDLNVHVDTSTTLIRSSNGPLSSEELSFKANKIINALPAPPFIGSNSWIIGPSKTTSGKVLFANDPHIGFSQPSVWYEAHIETPDMSLYGNYAGGYPFPHVGHTDHHAIGLTMFENDDIDLYREKVNPENSMQYEYNGKMLDFQTSQAIIPVKGEKADTIQLKRTHHGPVVTPFAEGMNDDEVISLWWTYVQFPNDLIQASYEMMNASNMAEARKGASMIHGPGLNVMYGDAEGNIAWWAAARLPRRPRHVNSKLVLDGSTDRDEILGYYSFEENPQAENPPWGYVYSANNQSIKTDSIIHPGYYLPEDRARRIVKLLESRNDWDVAAVKKMQLDVTSENAPEIVRDISSHLSSENPGPEVQKWLERLANWDGSFTNDSPEAIFYAKLIFHVLHLGMADELGDHFEIYNGTHVMKRSIQVLIANEASVWWDNIHTSQKESISQVLKEALDITISELNEQLGPDIDQWRWTDVHTLEHGHALGVSDAMRPYLNVGPFGVNGTSEVINNLMFKLSEDGEYEVYAGPSCRRIVDFDDVRNNSWSILPTGQSGNVLSPHYKDQAKMYAEGKYRLKMMEKDQIINNARYKSVFKPN